MSEDRSLTAEALAELDRQVEQGGLHTHTAFSLHAERINRLEAFVYGLADLFLDAGTITEEQLRVPERPRLIATRMDPVE